jgi:hypothetical protein
VLKQLKIPCIASIFFFVVSEVQSCFVDVQHARRRNIAADVIEKSLFILIVCLNGSNCISFQE